MPGTNRVTRPPFHNNFRNAGTTCSGLVTDCRKYLNSNGENRYEVVPTLLRDPVRNTPPISRWGRSVPCSDQGVLVCPTETKGAAARFDGDRL